MDDFGAVLRRVMADRGVGVRELARRVPCDHALISRLLSGRQVPSPGMARRVDEVLEAGGDLVAAAGGVGWEVAAGSGGLAGRMLAGALAGVTAEDLGGEITGRAFGDAAGRAMAVLDGWGASRSSQERDVMVLSARQVGVEELAVLEATAEVFREWGHQFGGGLRRKAVVGQLSELAELLREPHPRVLRRRLLRVTAMVAIVAGHMSGDIGLNEVAHGYFALALDAAREAADDGLGARAVAAVARRLADDGRARDAVVLLDRAERGLRRAGPDGAALLALGRAWGLAIAGRADGVSRALDRARGLADGAGVGLLGPAELAGVAGACFEVLASRSGGARARAYADQAAKDINLALSSREPVYARSRAFDLAGLAEVRLRQRELEEALAAGELALEQVGRLRSARVRRRMHRLAIRVLEEFPGAGQAEVFADRVRAQVPVT